MSPISRNFQRFTATSPQAADSSVASSAGAPRFYGLDGLRAVSVLAVVWHHSHGGWSWMPASQKGFLGVDVFFVISGFLITMLLLMERNSTGRISLKNFLIRRSLRIFPLYYAVLGLLAAYMFFARDTSSQAEQFFRELPYHATYTSNWISSQTLMAISWSLSTEEQFYLVWPLLLVLLGHWSLIPLGLFLALNQAVNYGLLDGWLAAIGLPYAKHEILQATFTPIILGVLLAFAVNSPRWRLVREWIGSPWVPVTCILLIVWLANSFDDIRGSPRLLIQVATTALIASVVFRPQGYVTRALEWRPAVLVGMVSYGIYLLHMIAIDFCRRAMQAFNADSTLLLFGAAWLTTLAMAALSYRFFERPLLKLKERYR